MKRILFIFSLLLCLPSVPVTGFERRRMRNR